MILRPKALRGDTLSSTGAWRVSASQPREELGREAAAAPELLKPAQKSVQERQTVVHRAYDIQVGNAVNAYSETNMMMNVILLRIVACALLLLSASVLQAKKIAKDLETASPEEDVDLIVRFKPRASAEAKGKLVQLGGVVKADLPIIDGAAITLKGKHLKEVEKFGEVEYVARDRVVGPFLDVTRPTLNADLVSQTGLTGAGIGVAVLDSGISDVPDIKGRIVYKKSFTPNGTGDVYGHGTMVAGIIAGSGKDSAGKYKGLAPSVRLVNLKVLADDGSGRDSYVIAAIQKAIELKSTYNIRVINLSVGRDIVESYALDPLCQAVEAAWKAGIVVVVAAGNGGREDTWDNQGYATVKSPANDPFVITVGAMKTMGTPSRADDLVASYSSKGPTLVDHFVKPDLVAPGNRVVTTGGSATTRLEKLYPENTLDKGYFRMSGTSLAAPSVAATAALMIQKDPTLTPDQVKARLLRTSTKTFPMYSTAIDDAGKVFTSQYDIFTVGAGYLDTAAALNDTTRTSGLALSPMAVFDNADNSVSVWLNWYSGLPDGQTGTVAGAVPEGTSIVWGSSVIWGTSIVWGTSVWVNGSSICWGTGVVWGTGSPSGTTIVWGTVSPFVATSEVSGEAEAISGRGEN